MSFYIVKNKKILASCDRRPDENDLASRGETAIEDPRVLDISMIAEEAGRIVLKPAEPVDQVEQLEKQKMSVDHELSHLAMQKLYDFLKTNGQTTPEMDALKQQSDALSAQIDTEKARPGK